MKTAFSIIASIFLITSCKYSYVKDYTGDYNFDLYSLAYDSLGNAYYTDTITCTGTISRYQDGDADNATTSIETYTIAPDEKAWLTISYNGWKIICHVDENGVIESYAYGTSYSHSGEFTDDTHLILTTDWGGLGFREITEAHGEKINN